MKHTPTPWTYNLFDNNDGTKSYYIQSADEKQAVAELYVQPEARGNAQLIMFCVNALEGIENPEAIKELIGALKKIANLTEGHPVDADRRDKIYELATQALANLKRGG